MTTAVSLPESKTYFQAGSDKDLGMLSSSPFDPRVLFVSTTKANGGADRHAVGLAGGMQARGANIVFACRRGRFTELRCRDAGIPTEPFTIANSGDLAAVGRFAALILRHRIEIVHAHARRDFVPITLAVALARRLQRARGEAPARLLLHVHLIRTLGQPDITCGKFFTRYADGVVAVSDSVASLLNDRHQLPTGFVRRIFNGIDLTAYAAPGSGLACARRRIRRERWGIPEDAPVIGMVGRLHEKGQIEMLRALPELIGRFPDLRVVFAGPFKFPGDHWRFQELAAHLGVSRNVVVSGIEEDVPAAMAAFDILVHLPTDEAFGLVLVEAMASGLPVVATAIGGCREVVVSGRNGLLVAPHRRAALVDAVGALLAPESGPALRRQMGRAGRQSATAYSERVQLDDLQALYREICPRTDLTS